MTSPNQTARIAGFLYLIVVLAGIFSLLYVPSKTIAWDSATETVNLIRTSETLFRLGIVAGIICYLAFLFLPLVLYRLLHHVHKTAAVSMVALAVVSVPVSFVNLLHKVNVLTLLDNPDLTQAVPAAVMQSLHAYDNGIQLLTIFWGLWLLPFGYLVYRSGMLPKILGVFLMLGCFGYLINFTGNFLFEDSYSSLGIGRYVSLPASIGEIGTCLWLLIAGVRGSKK